MLIDAKQLLTPDYSSMDRIWYDYDDYKQLGRYAPQLKTDIQ